MIQQHQQHQSKTQKLLREQIPFLIPFLIFFIIGLWAITQHGKVDLHVIMNDAQNVFLFPVFNFITYLGNGITILVLCILALLINVRIGLTLGAISVLNGIIIQLLKRNVFEEFYRPGHYLDAMTELSKM